MSEQDPDFDDIHSRISSWYAEIFPAGPRDGFYHKLGQHSAAFVDRGDHQLVVSFDNLSDAGYPGYDPEPWATKFIRQNGWSHLGVMAQGPTWFRDAQIIGFLELLRDQGFFSQFKRVAMVGTSMGAFAALTFSSLAPGATVVAMSPQSTLDRNLVGWESRFQKGQAQDWSLPYSDAADQLGRLGRAYVLYDPFLAADLAHVERLPQDNLVHLKGFGLGHKTALLLRRMERLKPVMAGAINGTLTEAEFYSLIRARKDLYVYRRAMEEHLADRGRDSLIPQFRKAFQTRSRQKAAAEAQDNPDPEPAEAPPIAEPAAPQPEAIRPEVPVISAPAATEPDPIVYRAPEENPPQAAPKVSQTDAPRPRTRGNVWMARATDHGMAYLSDQYAGRVMGYEQRGAVTLAQTPDLALGAASFGGTAVQRPLPERFDYHLRRPAIAEPPAPHAAAAHGVALLGQADHAARALSTVIAMDQPISGAVARDAAMDAAPARALLAQVEQAARAMEAWDKVLFVDRIALSLLGGAPETPFDDAVAHYATAGEALARAVAQAAGQSTAPLLVVSQSAGTRDDGRSTVALAEGMLDILCPALGAVVATPKYPFALMEGTAATHAPEAQMLIDELEAQAVATIQSGARWYCPSLRQADLRGTTLRVAFNALTDLEFEGAPAGFAIEAANAPEILSARVEGKTVLLELDAAPEGDDVHITYAWGAQGDAGDGHAANRGTLRDGYAAPSLLAPGQTLHRYALSGRIRLMRTEFA
ncbi:MAG: hypothetical protein CSA72_10665 [Rhodobacterales bacterium]|nr:MAG: hypothetical protein CSA72_10665 [Rhodobacterales bacterium]